MMNSNKKKRNVMPGSRKGIGGVPPTKELCIGMPRESGEPKMCSKAIPGGGDLEALECTCGDGRCKDSVRAHFTRAQVAEMASMYTRARAATSAAQKTHFLRLARMYRNALYEAGKVVMKNRVSKSILEAVAACALVSETNKAVQTE